MNAFFIVLAIVLAQSSQANVDSINPDRIITPLLDICSPKNKKLSEDNYLIAVSTFDQHGEIKKGKNSFNLDKARFDKAFQQSSAVFEMIPEEVTYSGQTEVVNYLGTAFHIGENLVLTNHHVLSHDRSNLTSCDRFALHSQDGKWKFSCKKVHHCDEELDVCLIEMRPDRRCLNFFCTKEETYQLKDGPSLKLKKDPSIDHEQIDKIVMTAIGNTMGMGIHYSQGRGLRFVGSNLFFYAPLRTGNSGGPLIGEDGLVWGVVKQESAEKVSENAFNVAASMDSVIRSIRAALVGSDVLIKFNRVLE